MTKKRLLFGSLGSLILSLATCGVALAAGYSQGGLVWPLAASSAAFLVPMGRILIASGGSSKERAVPTALMGLAAIGLAVVGYFACGFAFQFGGIGLFSKFPGLEGLTWEWSPMDVTWGMGWGALGLHGFFLSGAASTPAAYALFLSQLPLVATAVLIPVLTLRKAVRPLILASAALLVSAVIYPVLGNWIWGGGWLANLGSNLGLGHGFVDFAGAGMVNLLGGMVALAGILVFGKRLKRGSEPARMPPVHLPLLAILGSLLVVVGWVGLALANPLYSSADLSPILVGVNLILASGGGMLASMLYSWFATGGADVLMSARGLVAGLVAASASCPFVPPWAALAAGVVAGLFLPLGVYLVEQILRLDDPAAAVATHAFSGLWGLISLALFADGRHGVGWNGVGVEEYLGIEGQGVSGYLTAPNFVPDWPGQLQAQLVGLAAIIIFSFALAWLFFKLLDLFARAWGKPSENLSTDA